MTPVAHADAWFHPGTTHLVCEDYATVSPPGASAVAAIVCDGCSGSADTDVGARVLAWAALAALAEGRLVDPGTAALQASVAARTLALPDDALDATLLAALVTPQGVRVVAAGDGVIGARHRDGRCELWQLEHPDGAPPYPSYVLDPDRRRDYLVTFGDTLVVRHRAPDGTWSTSTAEGGQLCLTLDPTEVDLVLLGSDGLAAFCGPDLSADDEGPGTTAIAVETIVGELLGVTHTAGRFAARRGRRLLHRTCPRNGWRPLDDVGIAAIALPDQSSP